jgi:hypothetical protein
MSRVAVIQSNYLPWKGYFDIIHDADVFVFYDDVQFTKNDWRNRNRIKTAQGVQWLTVPVGQRIDRLICEVMLDDPRWQLKHWKTLQHNYATAPHFKTVAPFFENIYCGRNWPDLSSLNQFLVERIAADFLGTRTKFVDSRSLSPKGDRMERLLHVLKAVKATAYISGPSAASYIGEGAAFKAAGIELIYKDYRGYPEYPQAQPPFEHFVSIVDLLFHCGADAPYYVWGWRREAERLAPPAIATNA